MRLVQTFGAMLQHFHQARLIQHRIGVRRAYQAGDAALHGGLHFRFQRSLVFVAGFTQTRTQVDQTRRHHQTVGVNRFVGGKIGGGCANTDDLACGNEQILLGVDIVFGVDQTAVFDVKFHL